MRFAYIILAHKNPEQVAMIIHRLQHPDDHFYVHIDAKFDVAPFEEACRKINSSNVHFVEKRENGIWGGLGIVRGTLNALKEIHASGLEFCHVHLLSGQDYPLKPISEIRSFFAGHSENDFIEFEAFPVKHLDGGGWFRIRNYTWQLKGKRYTYLPSDVKNSFSLKGKLINAVLGFIELFLPKRKEPCGIPHYYGSQWWSLTGRTANSVISYLNSHPEFEKFHQRSLLPDEMFFQTIVLQLASKKVVNDNKRLIVWEPESSHPVLFSDDHKDLLLQSNQFFARKFDTNHSDILYTIDKFIA